MTVNNAAPRKSVVLKSLAREVAEASVGAHTRAGQALCPAQHAPATDQVPSEGVCRIHALATNLHHARQRGKAPIESTQVYTTAYTPGIESTMELDVSMLAKGVIEATPESNVCCLHTRGPPCELQSL